MNILEFIKKEFQGFGKYERIFFPLGIILIILLSFLIGDSKIALISAICGISYTILAGKGKISCYILGLCGTMCYAYLAYKNHLYGNLFLYMLYYFPMQVIGIFKWKQHLKKEVQEIIKTKLSKKEQLIFFTILIIGSLVTSVILKKLGDASPFIDGITTFFSIGGLLLTIKRCIEQWYVWTIVNGLSVIMWIDAYINGSNCLATVIMWSIYFILGFYFLDNWKKELDYKKDFGI